MQDKIKLEICCGTTCYMLGAAELMTIEDTLPDAWKDRVDVFAIPCMDLCTREDIGRAPFVRIDGEVMGNATLETVHRALSKLLPIEPEEV
ncbi:MAG: hypothetical protein PHS41_01835 [Victivallaceae bacterium]|nr:hypothetical protein [Victivallaceae bacterium]